MATIQDALIAEIAVRTRVLPASLLDECQREQRAASTAGQRLSLLQVLVRRHLISPTDLVGLMKAIESAAFQCSRCAKVLPYGSLEPEGPVTCPACGAAITVRDTDSTEISARLRAVKTPPPSQGPMTPAGPPVTREDASSRFLRMRPPSGPLPRVFGPYEILTEVGRGGMGVVYKARQPSLERIVALKVLIGGELASPTQVKRFQREAEILARLKHPNIVAVHDVGKVNDSPYFTMDFIDGRSLADRIKARELAPREALSVGRDISRALEHAHGSGIVHRDVKPANILIDAQGRAFITDFGLARDLDDAAGRLTRSGATVGTPYYMSPEQARGDRGALSPASDIYSLGVCLYEAFTFELPFRARNSVDLAKKIVNEEPVRPRVIKPEIELDVETLVLKAMAKEPRDRYPNAAALAEDLERLLKGEPILARVSNPVARIAKRFVRGGGLTTVAIAGLVAGLVAGIAIFAYIQLGKIADERRHREEEQARQRADEEKKRKEAEAKLAAEAVKRKVEEKIHEAQEALSKADGARLEKLQELLRTASSRATDALTLDPNEPRAWFLRGRTREVRSEIDGALSDYARARELDQGAIRAESAYRAARLTYRSREDVAATVALLGENTQKGPPPWQSLSQAVIALIQDQDPAKGLELAEKAIAQDESCADAYQLAAICLADPKIGRLRDALARIDRALDLDRKQARTWAHRGLLRANLGQVDDAFEDANRALELDPDEELALGLRSQILAAQKRFPEAIADLKRLIQVTKRTSEPSKMYLELGRLYVLDDKIESAQQAFEKAKAAAPGEPEPYLLLARAYVTHDLLDLSLRELKAGVQAVKGEKAKDALSAMLLELLVDNRRFEEAEAFAKARVDEVGNADPRPRHRLALLYGIRDGPGDFDRSLAIFEKLAVDFPNDVGPVDGKVKLLLHAGRTADAKRAAEELTTKLSNEAQAWLLASSVHRVTGDPDRAIEEARKALSLAPRDPDAIARCALAEVDAHKYTEAEQRLRDAIPRFRDHAGLQIALGALQIETGQPALAQAAFARALQLDPTDVEAVFGLGRALVRLGQFDRAIRLGQDALRAGSKHPGIVENLGIAYLGKRRFAEAVKQLGSIAPDARDPTVLLAYADALEGSGEKAKAVEWARRAAKLDPEFKPAREWLARRGEKLDEPKTPKKEK
jgi:tetratricopeptide (TPR) repeat protein/tRNA A-37 threonylcarbamoyl transferase component Bud32